MKVVARLSMVRTESVSRTVCAAIALVSMGCDRAGTGPNAPTPLTSTQIDGPWRLTEIESGYDALTEASGSTRFTLSIADGDVVTRADCNVCEGRSSYTGAALHIGPLSCPAATCGSAPLDTLFTYVLDGSHLVRGTASRLELVSSRGTLYFVRWTP